MWRCVWRRGCVGYSLTYFGTRPSDRAQIWHACADRYSHLKKKLTHPTPGGFRGLNSLARLALARERTPSHTNFNILVGIYLIDTKEIGYQINSTDLSQTEYVDSIGITFTTKVSSIEYQVSNQIQVSINIVGIRYRTSTNGVIHRFRIKLKLTWY